jgi:hypothetical protein
MTMGSTTRAHRRRLRLAVAGAVVLTALTAATAAASAPTQTGGADARLSRLGVGASSGPATDSSTRPRTPVPGFLLDRGRYTTFDPDDNALTLPLGINDRGQIVGLYLNPDTAPSRQRAGTQPLPGMGQALSAR